MAWRIIIGSIIIVLYLTYSSLAQDVQTTTAHHEIGPLCEGQVFEIGLLDEFSCFHIKFGSRYCPNNVEYSAEDQSDNIQVSGAQKVSFRVWRTYSSDGKNDIKVWLYSFIAERTTEISIICRSPIDVVIPDGCTTPEKSYIQERVFVYTVKVTPKPPKPSLTSAQYIAPADGTGVKFIASGCPTSIEGYDYQWNNTFCKEEAVDRFGIGDKDGTRGGFSGMYYRVLCSANNGTCRSEPTDFKMGLTYRPPDPSCVPPDIKDQIDLIDHIKQTDGYASYHSYTNTTEICNTSDPNCSVSNVFDLMISANGFITPIPSDLPFITYGADENYTSGFDKVQTCTVVNLPGLGEELLAEMNDPNEDLWSHNYNNPIMTYIDRQDYSTINYTLKGHLFSPGKVIRKIIEVCDKIYVITIGEGISDSSLFSLPISWLNKNKGEDIFKNVDDRLKLGYQEKYKP